MNKTHNLFTLMCIARNGATPATHGKRGKADHKNCRLIVICNVSISTSREWAISRRGWRSRALEELASRVDVIEANDIKLCLGC